MKGLKSLLFANYREETKAAAKTYLKTSREKFDSISCIY
jgi:hypothetical protein